CRWFALADESCSSGIARTDIGNGHCCNRSGRSANESLLRLILRADMRCSLSSFSPHGMANSPVFCCSSGRDRDFGPATDRLGKANFSHANETLQRIQGWLTPSANEKSRDAKPAFL